MKNLQTNILIEAGPFSRSDELAVIIREVTHAIDQVCWPADADLFTLNPIPKGNGVKPIKNEFVKSLSAAGWKPEQPMRLGSRLRPGRVDCVKDLNDGRVFALEWETGNISSSHRALNKLAIGLLDGVVAGGILVLPSRDMYRFLTDRVGNYAEIEPYFPVWAALSIQEGFLAVIEIEHDALSAAVPQIPKGTDGRALV